MRIIISILIAVFSLSFTCCKDYLNSRFVLELPRPPEIWVALLGEPSWRVEWLDPNGQKRKADIPHGESLEIELPNTWINPVAAWPYWPACSLAPGAFKPAGALFPFDVAGKSLHLSWKAGPDTVFYWELALASQNNSRSPVRFDWPRFRELFETDVLNEEVRKDPWLVDWALVAEKTASSSFDRRRLVPKPCESVIIPVSSGPWYGSSPFAEPLLFTEGAPRLFPVINANVDVWISAEGILRCNRNAWMFTTNKDSLAYSRAKHAYVKTMEESGSEPPSASLHRRIP
jgi:hypothetical protein